MTVRRLEDTIRLEGLCPVDEAEILMQELQSGAQMIDWSGCTHLHTACLQVILAARVPVCGKPANPALEHWIPQLLLADAASERQTLIAGSRPACSLES